MGSGTESSRRKFAGKGLKLLPEYYGVAQKRMKTAFVKNVLKNKKSMGKGEAIFWVLIFPTLIVLLLAIITTWDTLLLLLIWTLLLPVMLAVLCPPSETINPYLSTSLA